MCKKLTLLLLLLPVVVTTTAGCPEVKLQAVRLPDLNVPRSGHTLFVVNGEPTVVGGHTDGFVPTATAEYYSNGEWHLMETVYTHDQGISLPLRSGQVLIGGGHEQPLGIGQLFSVEMYNPATHSFQGFGCLDRKRCFATGIEQDSGRVIITGNWYNGDGIEQFDGQKYFTHVKDVSQPRACPFVFPVAGNDVLVFSSIDHHADAFDTIIVDRLRGEPMRVPLFDEWKPVRDLVEVHTEDCHIGNQVYLVPVDNSDGQVAICRVDADGFTLLPTESSVPTEYQGSKIFYYHSIYADRQARCAYLVGYSRDDGRLFVLAIGYDTTPSPLTLYYTEPMEPLIWSHPVLMPDGNLLVAGGAKINADGTVNNFSPVATTLLLPLGRPQTVGQASSPWPWIVLAVLLLSATVVAIRFWRRKRQPTAEEAKTTDSIDDSAADEALMQRICQLMDEERLFLNSDLKMADVATRLGSNASYVSSCINQLRGCSFNQFVNGYRIDYAKQLLRQHPDKKVSEVWASSGFANETSFFRTFNALTGMTPNEWRAQID